MDVPTEIRAFETRAFEFIADLCRGERWPLGLRWNSGISASIDRFPHT